MLGDSGICCSRNAGRVVFLNDAKEASPMPEIKKKTLFIACGEFAVTIITACLLSASVNSTADGHTAPVTERNLEKLRDGISSHYSIIDADIEPDIEQTGRGSWYGGGFHLRKTASGERFNMHDFTAAHRSLPFGTIVRVTDLTTEKSVLVCINDRGPFIRNKVIDLSRKAAQVLGGNLKHLKLEAYLPGKSLLEYNAKNDNEADTVIGFGVDLQLKAIAVDDGEPRGYAKTFSDALIIQKELREQFPDQEVIVSKASPADSDGRYAVFVTPVAPDAQRTVQNGDVF